MQPLVIVLGICASLFVITWILLGVANLINVSNLKRTGAWNKMKITSRKFRVVSLTEDLVDYWREACVYQDCKTGKTFIRVLKHLRDYESLGIGVSPYYPIETILHPEVLLDLIIAWHSRIEEVQVIKSSVEPMTVTFCDRFTLKKRDLARWVNFKTELKPGNYRVSEELSWQDLFATACQVNDHGQFEFELQSPGSIEHDACDYLKKVLSSLGLVSEWHIEPRCDPVCLIKDKDPRQIYIALEKAAKKTSFKLSLQHGEPVIPTVE